MMEKGSDLLRAYLAEKSEGNFRAVVEGHSAMVQATAIRYLKDPVAAEDISQQVFVRFARKASRLSPGICLAGWLYRQTCRISLDALRAERRRHSREKKGALAMNQELLTQNKSFVIDEIDDAMNELSTGERDALVLRYFEDRSHRSVGETLGISEEAARKRCERATETLREVFLRRGSGITTSALVVGLGALSTGPLPAATTRRIANSAYQGSGSAPVGAAGFLSFAGGLALAAVVAGGVHAIAPGLFQRPATASLPNTRETPSSRRNEVGGIVKEISVAILIAEVKQLYRGPHNAMMTSRLSALFEALPAAQRRNFILQAEEDLSAHEKVFAYRPFFTDWLAVDPRAAFDTLLTAEMISGSLSKDKGIVTWLFEDWNRRNAEEAENWLRTSWGDPELAVDGFGGTIQSNMARSYIVRTLKEEGVDAAFAKAGSFGSPDEFVANLKAITGTTWHQIDPNFAVEVYEKIRSFDDVPLRDQLTTEFLENWRSKSGKHLVDSLAKLTAGDRIPAALFLLSYQAPMTKIRRLANGGQIHGSEKIEMSKDERIRSLEKREEALHKDASGIGMDVSEMDFLIARQYSQEKKERFGSFIERLPDGPSKDQLIVDGVRQQCLNHNRGSAKEELTAFKSALLISDQSTRDGVVRALYRRIYSKDPDAAAEMLQSSDLPQDAAAIIRETAHKMGL